ncbi:---NA--- [Octopus vulgaris]|uniref:---NA n=1 Tax=Octopus vulgaris TaxID=6645 RepID=A0AA36BEF1_OCTVU|nr:---NA--- [Octopus vulgaris]
MHVLKNWELSECIENIDKVIDEARGKEILNEHEKNYVKSFEHGSYEESRKLMEMVSCYGDQLKTFLDILNETGNEQLARRISEKKYEFVFMIRSKDYLNAKGRHNHCSLLPRSIPTQFIYESKVKDVIKKLKEKYECRKPIADRFYVVIVCKKWEGKYIYYTDEDEILIYDFIEYICDILDKSKEIKIIAIVDANGKNEPKKENEFLGSVAESTDMYIIEKLKDEELRDFMFCENVMDLLRKIDDKKMFFFESFVHIIMHQKSSRKIENQLRSKIKQIKVESTKTNKLDKVEDIVKEIEYYSESKIKRIIMFFADGFLNLKVALDFIKKLFTHFSNSKKEIHVLIRKAKESTIPENISLKESDWDKRTHMSFYVMGEKEFDMISSSREKQISVDDFLREYCSKIGYAKEQ